MRRWLLPGLVLCVSGCGVSIPLLLDYGEFPEGFSRHQERTDYPLEFRFLGNLRGWKRTEAGAILLRSGTVLAVRSPELTMFRAALQLRSSAGYRLVLRTTPQEWLRRHSAPVVITVLPERTVLQTAVGTDTLELPAAGSHRWELVQLNKGFRARFECLPPVWIPAATPLTEWLLVEPLPGSEVVLEAASLEEPFPFVVVEQQGE